MTSTATISPTLLGVLNIGDVTVDAASTAKTAATGLELAMVLDNTGSMAGSSITALIDASSDAAGYTLRDQQRHAAESHGVRRAFLRDGQYWQDPHRLANDTNWIEP